jgi:molybdopterin converting factor small subunit|tara:strand:+ start:1243 stop:1488 length:246 start_codon:yes stop_codon:yes gene_type:complete
MIQVKVKCFSQVKYVLGKDEMSLALEPGTTSAELEKLVRNQAQGKLDEVTLRIAVNQKYILEEIELKNGDEVAFIPPVQGG